MRILVVDDEPGERKTRCQVLEMLGHTVDTAISYTSAVAKLVDSHNNDKPYNCAVIDCNMPDPEIPKGQPHKEGPELAEYIEEYHPRMGIVMLTGAIGLEELKRKKPVLNRIVVLKKPGSVYELKDAIERFADNLKDPQLLRREKPKGCDNG